MTNIPFNKPFMTGKELTYISQAHTNGHLAGDGQFTKMCSKWLEDKLSCKRALLTHSCTAALEMAALLIDVAPGDEVIMPSYTFVSTANAFVLRGAIPVFVDVRKDTLNIDEKKIEAAISSKTKAIVVVHYAGVACDMDVIMDIATKHGLFVIEDAAQAILSSYRSKFLGSIGHIGCLSFHETKNIISGEGGAILINESSLIERAEIIREKGTDRSRFFRGQVDKYTWQDIGSSFLPGEITAAFLWAQLEEARQITAKRRKIWQTYFSSLKLLEASELVGLPHVPHDCDHNAHLFYLLVSRKIRRDDVLSTLRAQGVHSVFHYIPLHSSPAGMRYGRTHGSMENTDLLSEQLIRLPLWIDLSEKQIQLVIDTVVQTIEAKAISF